MDAVASDQEIVRALEALACDECQKAVWRGAYPCARCRTKKE